VCTLHTHGHQIHHLNISNGDCDGLSDSESDREGGDDVDGDGVNNGETTRMITKFSI
jgi:hypothetical protein